MKFKKILAAMLAGTMVLSLAACGGSSDDASSNDASNSGSNNVNEASTENGTASNAGTSSDVTLSVQIWDTNQEPGLSTIIQEFTAETGIKAKVSVVTWDEYWTGLEAGAQGGSLPDVFWMHSNESQRYMSNDMLLNVTDYIAASDLIDPENYPEDIWGLYTYEDNYYAVPKDVDTIAVWYNKAMFDEAGLEYPTADWTWDDLVDYARALTKEDGSQYGIALRNDNNQAGYYNMVYDAGGFVISDDKKTAGWDSPEAYEGMKTLETLINEGLMPSAETMAENSEDVLFTSGKVAMVIQGSWMLAAYRDNEYTAANADVVELPKNATTGRRVSIYNGLGWAAAASTKYPAEAWALIEYLCSEKGQLRQAELGVTMSAYKGTSDAWANAANFNLQAYLNMMDDMVIRPYSRSTVTWENKNSEILLKVYTGELTMQEALNQMAAQMNEKLAEE